MSQHKTVGFIGGKFLPFHLGHMYAIIAASNKVDELYVVLSSSENRDKEICSRDGVKYMPAEARMSWIGESLANLDNVKVLHIQDAHWDDDYDWGEGAAMIKNAIGKSIDCVFSSETSYDGHFRKYYPDSRHIVIDEGRDVVPISATDLRQGIYSHWEMLPSSVRAYFVKKVAIVGTESCGKTTLVKKLAKFYNTSFVPEVGRQYCERYKNCLTSNMFDDIAMEHSLLQRKMAQDANKILLVDSEAVVTQYYLDMYFRGQKSSLVEEIIRRQDFDLVLYLEPDVPWVDDGLRFAGKSDVRVDNDCRLKEMFAERGIRYTCIGGDYEERFNRAKECIDSLFR